MKGYFCMRKGINIVDLNFNYQNYLSKLLLPDVGRANLYATAKYTQNGKEPTPYLEVRKGKKTLCTLTPNKDGFFKAKIESGQMLNFKNGDKFELVEVEHAIRNLEKKVNIKGFLKGFAEALTKIR